VPSLPECAEWDLDSPGSRFTFRPALGLLIPESEWPAGASDAAWRAIVEQDFGGWILEADEELGHPRLLQGEIGRGASGPLPVVEWLLEPAVKGVVSAVAAAAAFKIWRRVRHGEGGVPDLTSREEPKRSVVVSRGMAVLLAAASVRETFREDGDLRLEAVEEPSAIAGQSMHELNYVGLEPWIVLLRNQERLARYVVVVEAQGEILGALQTPMSEWEILYWDLTVPD
jgi:hypothetical protein